MLDILTRSELFASCVGPMLGAGMDSAKPLQYRRGGEQQTGRDPQIAPRECHQVAIAIFARTGPRSEGPPWEGDSTSVEGGGRLVVCE